jgi:anti-anti-sigma factor
LLSLFRPAASRLVVDLSAARYADVSGLAVMAGSGHRVGLLGGWLRLASLLPEVARALSATGINQRFSIFSSVHAAISGVRAYRPCHQES